MIHKQRHKATFPGQFQLALLNVVRNLADNLVNRHFRREMYKQSKKRILYKNNIAVKELQKIRIEQRLIAKQVIAIKQFTCKVRTLTN